MRNYEELYLKVVQFEQNDVVTASGIKEVEDTCVFGDIFE